QVDSGLGLEAQRQRIAAYCDLKELRLAEVFEDPGISGGKPLASRPAGSQLLAAANKSKALVIVAKLDRGRGDPDSTILLVRLELCREIAKAKGFLGCAEPECRIWASLASLVQRSSLRRGELSQSAPDEE